MFYSDVKHEVRANGCVRATMSFKVFVDNPQNGRAHVSEHLLEQAKRALDVGQPLGFLLSYKYSHGSTALKGKDDVLFSILQASGLFQSLDLVPVIVHNFGKADDDFDERNAGQLKTIESNVYRLNDQDLEFLSSVDPAAPGNPPQSGLKDVPFFRCSSGYTWKHNYNEFIEYTGNETGNESRPEDLDSIYLQKAVIAVPK